MTRELALQPLAALEADPRNPKAHDLTTITQSVNRFGYMEPVVVDQRTGYIVSGHGRVETLRLMREAGHTPPEGVTVQDDEWLIPVVTGWSSSSDSEAHAALIALNRTTELGGWVDDELLNLLDSLDNQLDGVGYDEKEIERLRRWVDAANSDFGDFGEEWENAGMPDFKNDDATSYRRVVIHFADQHAVEQFAQMIGADNDLPKIMWYPPVNRTARPFVTTD